MSLCLACRQQRNFVVAAAASGGGKRITQNEFTDKAWQAIVAAPDIAKQVGKMPSCCAKSEHSMTGTAAHWKHP